LPSTCGCIVADRRLLIVATYVSELATLLNETGCTCTGIACGGAAGGAAFSHPINIARVTAVIPAVARKLPCKPSNKRKASLLQISAYEYTRKRANLYNNLPMFAIG
jgi:hypothetical protein